MGFIRDFGSKPPSTANPPQAPANGPASETTPPRKPKQRGFFADFNPEAALAAEQPQDTFVPRYTEQSEESVPLQRGWSGGGASETLTSSGSSSPSVLYQEQPGETRPIGTTFGSSLEIANLTNEIQSVADKLKDLSSSSLGGGWESGSSQIEQEIGRTKQALNQAKETVQQKRARLQRLERFLDRTKQMISRMEMRMSGFDSGWTRGYGGGGRWRHNDEFLFSRGELRGPENADERKAQMALVLDSRRDRVWKLQDEISATRSGYMQTESKVKELEQKLGRLQDKLSETRSTKQNRKEQKTQLENKLQELKDRYRKLTGRSYGQFF